MIFHHGVRRFVGVGGDAFGAGDVDESAVADFVSGFGDGVDGFQFRGRIEKAFVAAGDVVIDLDAEDVALGGFADDVIGLRVGAKAEGADADPVGPIGGMLGLLCWRV